ncbi:MAG: isocitrate lyase/PEP mutase family protein [Alphaproteobacteria bacterium]|nr:isocitrate lyase/PEP mutase family protein [Alphaproteobacteria bacterium]
MPKQIKVARRLRQLLKRDKPILFAGVYDALSARIAERAGFDGVWVSGYAVAATLLGTPDIGLVTLSEMVERARHIARAVDIPVVVDGEVGYGNALNVMRTVQEFIDAGAVGMQLGDEAQETCPYLGMPTKILDLQEAVLKIKAAIDARGDGDFLIFSSPQHGLDRAVAYAKAGADGVLMPRVYIAGDNPDPKWVKALKEVRKAGAAPVAINTPFIEPVTNDRLAKAGYKVIVCAVENLYASAKVQADLWREYMTKGTTKGFANRMYTKQDEFLPLVNEASFHRAAKEFLTADYVEIEERKRFAR